MTVRDLTVRALALAIGFQIAAVLVAQGPPGERPDRRRSDDRDIQPPPSFPPPGPPGLADAPEAGPGGNRGLIEPGLPRGPRGGFGGLGGPPGAAQTVELLRQFDQDQNGWLDDAERAAARKFLESDQSPRRAANRLPPARAQADAPQAGARPGRPPGPPPGSEPGPPPGAPFGRPWGPPRPDFQGPPEFAPGPGQDGQRQPGPPDQQRFPPGPRGFSRGPGDPGGMNRQPPRLGPSVSISEVQPLEGDLYDPSLLRTIFIDFANAEWESELELFHDTDVEVPATVTVDGQSYAQVGIRFRGMSSYRGVPAGYKRSMNLSFDLADPAQRLYGYKTLNLLNGHGDPSLLSTVLYSHIARQYMPAPKANLARVVINGESWGIYTNVQQFNKEFLEEHYASSKGTRWKVTGRPNGRGGLEYLGDNPEDYQPHYEMKSNDPKAWQKLIRLTQTLSQTPIPELPAAIASMIDVDEVLWFLALDNALCNSDGYWVRASDYSLFMDQQGVFHLFPHDMNEAFRPARGGPGMGGPGMRRGDILGLLGGSALGPPFGLPPNSPVSGRSADLDPLVGLDDPRMPLRSRLLADPELREQYLANVRTIARQSLDWEKLGPLVAQLRELIEPYVAEETRGLSSYEQFVAATSTTADVTEPDRRDNPRLESGPGPGRTMNLRQFIEQRQRYLLDYQPEGGHQG